ncbi:MAG: SUMF1/EgtB/PvdO family nonheme iron enzyme [Aggregatilineales bacterium]
MRLFISYAREDRHYCQQIAELLAIHEVWYDDRLFAGQKWWQEILRMLDWCEGFICLISPYANDSEPCQRELQLAIEGGKFVLPVLIEPHTPIPDLVRDLHYVDLSLGLTADAAASLLNAIHMAEMQRYTKVSLPVPEPIVHGEARTAPAQSHAPQAQNGTPHAGYDYEPVAIDHDPATIVGDAAEAMQNGRYDQAVQILKQAIDAGIASRFISLESLLNEASAALDHQNRMREMERDYRLIAELVKRKRTRRHGCEAFNSFVSENPNYDPENLSEICANEHSEMIIDGVSTLPAIQRPTFPLLEWCSIPAGTLLVLQGVNGHMHRETLYVDSFHMSKYPVTNAQYQLFIDDPDGYANPQWWDFSPHAQEWRQANPDPMPSQFQGDDRPRENVTWYEAMAFCNWLSRKTGLNVTLPTRQQWQRAARGDDNRVYPWGNEFDISLCNTRESKVRMTTLVMRYENGRCPYGVYDMAGNVWEWCLNGEYDQIDITTRDARAVQGGSYMSAYERAQTSFHFVLGPESHYGSIGFRLVCP